MELLLADLHNPADLQQSEETLRRQPAETDTMKAVVCALVLMLVCSVTVNALQCYTCDSGNCKVPADCPASANFCRTEANATYLSRTCEQSCVSDVNVYCCSTDLCG